MAEEPCAHPDCDCGIESGAGVSKGGKNYCSEFCAASEGASLEDCECGHSDCEYSGRLFIVDLDRRLP